MLWTEWRRNGLALREEVFAHLPGGGPVRTGMEPLFAWVRLSLRNIEAKSNDGHYGWWIEIERPHIRKSMSRDQNLIADPQAANYPDKLSLESTKQGTILIDPRGMVRLGPVSPEGTVTYRERTVQIPGPMLRVNLPAAKNATSIFWFRCCRQISRHSPRNWI